MSAFDLIAQRIRDRGPITVAELMSIALYHPEHGYYARAARRTGRNGDFMTSVDVGPLFGTLLSRQFAEMWRVMRPETRNPAPDTQDPAPETFFDLVEAGASNGQLARDILDAAEAQDPEFYSVLRLHLVEASPTARAAQRATLGHHATRLAASSARLPDAIHGVVYANELLDALPVHSVIMTEAGLRESYVDLDDRHPETSTFVERIGPLSNEAIARYLVSVGAALEAGWRAEVNLSALAWMTRACLSLHTGFIVLIDYGHEAVELYSATHAHGTLTSFVSHVSEQRRDGAVQPWLVDPGSRDITSHVDLTAVRQVAEDLGCRTLGMLDQTYFMLALGLTEAFGHADASLADTRRRLALKTLMLPGGLGSSHKVMVFGKNVGEPRLRGLSGPSRLT